MFKATVVNHSRRKLIRNLATFGAIVSFSSVCSTTKFLTNKKKSISPLFISSVSKGGDTYESTRSLMQFKGNTAQRFPDLIVHPADEKEVINAVEFAKANDLQIVCRTSGHNTAGAVLRNGGMLLDLSALTNLEIDEQKKTVTVQPGVLMAQFVSSILPLGLAFPTASCHTVCMSGYILGGGLGRHGHYFTNGPASNALISARVLLSDGKEVLVNKDNYADIYWAIKGCGPGFFGVILELTLKLFDEVAESLSRSFEYPAEQLTVVLDYFQRKVNNKDSRVDTSLAFVTNKVNNEKSFRVTITACTDKSNFKNKAGESIAKNLIDSCANDDLPNSWLTRSNFRKNSPFNMFTPSRETYTSTSNFYTENINCGLELFELYKKLPDGVSAMIGLKPNAQITGESNSIFSPMAPHSVSYIIDWKPSVDLNEVKNWENDFNTLSQTYSKGHYINQLDNETNPNKVKDCFTAEKWQRLLNIRKKYDPNNQFFTYLGLS